MTDDFINNLKASLFHTPRISENITQNYDPHLNSLKNKITEVIPNCLKCKSEYGLANTQEQRILK